MKLQVASDIHLEQNPGLVFGQVIKPSGDVLILAGDIGNPLDPSYYNFLKECSKAFKHTILIAGNHEYRRAIPMTMHDVDLNLKAMCDSLKNVYYLAHGQNMCIENVNFIGATMWTPIKDGMFLEQQLQQLEETWGAQYVNQGRRWGSKEMNKTFQIHLKHIEKAINWGINHNKKNVVVTHHAPLLDGPFKKKDLPLDYLYGTDLSQYIYAPAITAWFYGHTHHNHSMNYKGTLLASNQYGARGVTGWSKEYVVDI